LGLRVLAVTYLTIVGATAAALADDFAGTWTVTEVVESKKGFPWSSEVKYPRMMILEVREGRLTGHYTDQQGHSDSFELVAVVNRGRDLLLVHGGAGTKDPRSFSPVHHAKLVDGRLRGVVIAEEKLFEWVAERKRSAGEQ
jgi:hypothetical protein